MKHPLLSLFAVALLSIGVAEAKPREEAQRRVFYDAYTDLSAGRSVDLRGVERALEGYPLAPYLDYARLRSSMADASAAQINDFLSRHGHLPVAGLLRQSWLEQLVRRKAWDEFLTAYKGGGGAEFDCYALRARRARGSVDAQWIEDARQLWLVGRSQPQACDPVFAVLLDDKLLSQEDVWQRTTLAMENGEASLASYLQDLLEPARRQWVSAWLQVHKAPAQALAEPSFALEGAEAARIVRYGLRRLARQDAGEALHLLQSYRSGALFDPETYLQLQREVSLWSAYSHDPQALARLDALPDAAVDDQVRLWRAKLLLARQEWRRLAALVPELPAKERDDAQWRYWYAHALTELGRGEEAQALFDVLSVERHYYGFLAADRLGRAYRMNSDALPYADAELDDLLAEHPGLQRAKEFWELELTLEARREWHAAVKKLDAQEQGRAAALALRWGWYDQAIFTANGAGLHDTLELRFPTPFRESVERYSRKHRLDSSLTYALLRKESAFRADAISPAGAMGLMQVMPQTGKQMAQALNTRLPSSRALLDPEVNLDIGSAYLRKVLDRFDGNIALAAAAYNAGPHRVTEWISRYSDLPPALWIETISFHETRDYVKSVLAFHAVFDWQLNGEARTLTSLLKPIVQTSVCGGFDKMDRETC